EPRSFDRWRLCPPDVTLRPVMGSLPLLAVLLATAAAPPEGAVIALGVGQQKVIQLGNVARVAIGEPEIADVKQVGGGSELLITGMVEVSTELHARCE